MQAVADGDVDALTGMVTEDAEFWPDRSPRILGRSALAEVYRAAFARYSIEHRYTSEELEISGPWAFDRGVETVVMTPYDGGTQISVAGRRALMILHRDRDGAWRYARGMTNLSAQVSS